MQQNAEINDRVREIQVQDRETALRVAALALDYAVSGHCYHCRNIAEICTEKRYAHAHIS